jgi:uncharacterized protein (DUF488 family)
MLDGGTINLHIIKRPIITPCLFTIGYEGRSISDYVSLLLANRVRIVVDVRRNPISRKKGFSKRALSEALIISGIGYIHLPELGIDSSYRKNLVTEDDYKKLFSIYEKKLLPQSEESLKKLSGIIDEYGSVALTCFERDAEHCHRHCVAARIISGKKYPSLVVNL